ncbi:MAG: IalB family protein [Gammaproteobacteria bacterium]|nr:MAG: IalB family protein [Gammaproteobacteria bacterium]
MQFIKTAAIGAILSLTALMPSAYAVKNGQKFKAWEGKCTKIDKQNICGITQTISDADKNPVVNIFIRKIKGQKNPIAFVKVPLGVNLQAGLGFAVDKKEFAQVPYTVCDPAGCNAIFPVTNEIAEKMKKGSKLQVGMMLGSQALYEEGSLSGFTNALKAL